MVLDLRQAARVVAKFVGLLQRTAATEAEKDEPRNVEAGLKVLESHEGPCLLVNEKGGLSSAEVVVLFDVSCVNSDGETWRALSKGGKERAASKQMVRRSNIGNEYNKLLSVAKNADEERKAKKDRTFQTELDGTPRPSPRPGHHHAGLRLIPRGSTRRTAHRGGTASNPSQRAEGAGGAEGENRPYEAAALLAKARRCSLRADLPQKGRFGPGRKQAKRPGSAV